MVGVDSNTDYKGKKDVYWSAFVDIEGFSCDCRGGEIDRREYVCVFLRNPRGGAAKTIDARDVAEA
ncbi:MAG: hypothetical protein KIG72_11685, partial [Bradymonadales bacterium]|nr:hypothetical protein [Bradymonadales bacterium]